jgi:RNA polymerase sigma-70 factor (ECF subfamily)
VPKAFLTTVVTRLAIDHLRSARVRREDYIGQWLPEPLLRDPAAGRPRRSAWVRARSRRSAELRH